MERGTPRILKGTRDLLPREMRQRQRVLSVITCIFERYGYEPLETPAMEYLDVLTQKYGEESEKLIYKLAYKGGNTLALRYDLTVPMSRVVAMELPRLAIPFKRYQIQPVWRADRPQRGRLREFLQCDIDVIGSSDPVVDAEVLAVTNDILSELGFAKFILKVNSREILNALAGEMGLDDGTAAQVFRCLDKLDKIGAEGVGAEMEACGLEAGVVEDVLDFIGSSERWSVPLRLSGSGSEVQGARGMLAILDHSEALGVPQERLQFDRALVRGLDYYTGFIFEAVVEKPRIGSLVGGGRYDHLISSLSGEDVPACGMSMGLDRIMEAMEAARLLREPGPVSRVLVVLSSRGSALVRAGIRVAQDLRRAGVNAELYPDDARLKKQLSYANRKGIPFVVIVGPDELAQQRVGVRDMGSGEQTSVPMKDAAQYLKERVEVS